MYTYKRKKKKKQLKHLGTAITDSNNVRIELVNKVRAENAFFLFL